MFSSLMKGSEGNMLSGVVKELDKFLFALRTNKPTAEVYNDMLKYRNKLNDEAESLKAGW